MHFIGLNGQTYNTENSIGKGGEGDVYSIRGLPGFVLKTYNAATLQRSSRTREEKLKAMAASSINSDMVAWPKDVVYANGRFAGFVMPAVIGYVPLNYLYATDDKKYNLDLSKKITLARNLCAAIHAVHSLGQVCGDLNPANILADPNTGRIMLVDTDSFHIKDIRGRIYRCEVGMGSFFPAELLSRFNAGQVLATMPLPTFTQQTDLFALSVLIFQLLMQGCSPFSCAVSSAVKQKSVACPQPEENILKGNFPFAIPVPGIVPPPYAPDFNYLPPNVRYLFVRAFIDGFSDPMQRPTASEWHKVLGAMKNILVQCAANQLHKYPNNLVECPWCKIDRKMQQFIVNAPAAQQLAQHTFSHPQYSVQSASSGTYSSVSLQSYSISSAAAGPKTYLQHHKSLYVMVCAAVGLLTQIIWQNTIGGIITGEVFGYSYGTGFFSWAGNIAIWLQPIGYCLLATFLIYAISADEHNPKKSDFWLSVPVSLLISFTIKLFLLFFIHPIYAVYAIFILLPIMWMFASVSVPLKIFGFVALIGPMIWEYTIGWDITGKMFGYEYGTGFFSWARNIAIWLQPTAYALVGLISVFSYLREGEKYASGLFAVLLCIAVPMLIKLFIFIFVSPLYAILGLAAVIIAVTIAAYIFHDHA